MEYKQRARRLTAIILALILVFLSADFEPFAELLSEITIIADAQDGSAATNPATGTRNNYTDFDPNCDAVMERAWLVYIQKVDNTHKGEDLYEYSETSGLVTKSQCRYSAVDAI